MTDGKPDERTETRFLSSTLSCNTSPRSVPLDLKPCCLSACALHGRYWTLCASMPLVAVSWFSTYNCVRLVGVLALCRCVCVLRLCNNVPVVVVYPTVLSPLGCVKRVRARVPVFLGTGERGLRMCVTMPVYLPVLRNPLTSATTLACLILACCRMNEGVGER